MEGYAFLKTIRVTPRKVGIVADEVRGKKLGKALEYLALSPKRRIAQFISTLLKSAANNATEAPNFNEFYVKTILVGQGIRYKRLSTRAKGSAHFVQKKTSNIKVIVAKG